ncbi:MAG: UvrD-helicase domain-containing protein [Clostridia bacterium]|nr:UvrD-helicase domain-containing protein [Clostridia bacterium]
MITSEELEKEKQYLDKVVSVLENEVESYESQVKNLSNNIQEQMTYAWDKTNRLSDTEFVYAVANIQKRSIYAQNANRKALSYKKMLKSAYFARIDFEDEYGVLPIYIGIASLENDSDFLVYDWRAPISSMFYGNEIGPASYFTAGGDKITGKINLKRQYKIDGREIKEIFDTDMQIIDSILKNILSANASTKMRNIVNTIQKEQNEIIRKNNVDLLVVQGPAGSGKTSIAMHKIAYLLYAERDKINNSNVMIISPNEIFNNYIADVLPEIGEDNVAQSTFYEFAKNYITELKIVSKLEDMYEVIYADNANSAKFNELKFKSHPIYAKILDDYIEENKLELLGLEKIEIADEEILGYDEIQKIASNVKSEGESLFLLGKKIVERVFLAASQKTQKQLTLEKLKKQAIENLMKVKIKISALYKKLYSNKDDFISFVTSEFNKYGEDVSKFNLSQIFDLTNPVLMNDSIEFQDVTPFMYLKSKIIGISANKSIKYVLIDEAQDYSIMQYRILSMLFRNSNITLLGDLNQSILPFNNHTNYDEIISTIKSYKPNVTSELCELEKTYRSTYEINEFAKHLVKFGKHFTQIDRHGENVLITKQDCFDPISILKRSMELKKSYNTVAIVCKNIEETLLYNQLVRNLEDRTKFRIVTKNDNVFVGEKIMIIPSYLAKGLEFDAVIVSDASSEKYSENESQLLYVVLTRALHKLEVYYTKNLTKILEGSDEKA